MRFYLRQKVEMDFAALYLQEALRLGALGMQPGVGARLVTAILGLSETGSASAADPIEVFTIDERPRVRKAALLCLGRLDGEQRQATLAAALSDPSPGVCQTALRALGTRIVLVGETALWRAIQEQRVARCRTYCVAALARLPRWAAVRCLLQACGDPDAAIATEAQRHLARWTAAVNAVRPTAEELATVDLLIERAPLQGSLLRELRFVLQTWR